MEEQAKGMTDAFLGTTTIGGLLINIFLIGIVAAVTEELFFRGLVQGIFHRWTGKAHAGIWIAAFLFSLYICSSTVSSPAPAGSTAGLYLLLERQPVDRHGRAFHKQYSSGHPVLSGQ